VDATSYYSYDAPAYYFSNNIALWTWTNQVACNVGDYPNGFDFPDVVYQLPGTPGITMDTHDVAAWFDSFVVFPTAGFYEMGVGSDDGFRLSEGIGLKRQVLHVTGTGIDTDVAAVVSTTNYGNPGFGATLPQTPISGPVFFVNSVTITFTGTLQSSTTVNGTYQDVSGATSPYPVPTGSAPAKFYRSHQ